MHTRSTRRQQLKELEQEGLIERDVQPTTPVSISYHLTPSGRQLISLLHPLVTWSRTRQGAASTRQGADSA
jgi:DNA-binding HxlR family transcriptional regulator